ncbi:MAG: hypothetical protein Q8K75_07640 [Chlamydiales bacterium]|nr:hypothetical protein [Chlamydiales bacterium]
MQLNLDLGQIIRSFSNQSNTLSVIPNSSITPLAAMHIQQAIRVEKENVDTQKILQNVDLDQLLPTLSQCPAAYRFMSLNCLFKNLITMTLNKHLRGDKAKLESILIDLGFFITNLYKGEVQEKQLAFDSHSLRGIDILAEESEDEEMKRFLQSLRESLPQVISSNFPTSVRSDFYWVPEDRNFFNVTVSTLLGNGSEFQNIEEKERTRVYLGTFFPIAARTAFETALFTREKICEKLNAIVFQKLDKFIDTSDYFPDKKKNGAWLMKKRLLSFATKLKGINEEQAKFYESCVKPSLEILAPSYMADLLKEGQMKTLKDELEIFSSECEKLCQSMVGHNDLVSEALLMFYNDVERYELFLIWTNKTYEGKTSFVRFLNENRTAVLKEKNHDEHWNRFNAWLYRYSQSNGMDATWKKIITGHGSLGLDMSPEVLALADEISLDLEKVRDLTTALRLQIRSHVNLVENYRNLEETKVLISLDDTDSSIESIVQDLAFEKLGEQNPVGFSPSINIVIDEQTTEASLESVDSHSYGELNEMFMTAFQKFSLSHPLAKQAFKDAKQAYKNLIAELRFPLEASDSNSHAHALVRFTCIMMEEIATTLILEKNQPDQDDLRFIRHSILRDLNHSNLNPKFIEVASRGYQVEQRMRYPHTDETSDENQMLTTLRQLVRTTAPAESTALLKGIYTYVEENLKAVGSILGLDENTIKIRANQESNAIDINLPSQILAHSLAASLDEMRLDIGQFLSAYPPSDTPTNNSVANHIADAAHLLDLVKSRLLRSSEMSAEYAELSTLLPLAIESLIIAIAGRQGGTLDLSKLDRKSMGHNLLELYSSNKIAQLLSKNCGIGAQSHVRFMRETRSLLSLTRYTNVQQATKGKKLDQTLLKQVKLSSTLSYSTNAPVSQDGWISVQGTRAKRTKHAQRGLKGELLNRTQGGILMARDLLKLFNTLHA